MRAPTHVTSAVRSLVSLGRPELQPSALAHCASLETRSSSSAEQPHVPPRMWLPAPLPGRPAGKHFAASTEAIASGNACQICGSPICSAAGCDVQTQGSSSASRSQPLALPCWEASTKGAANRSAAAPPWHSWLRRLPATAARAHPLQLYSPACDSNVSAERWLATRSAPRPLPPAPLPPPQGSGIEGVKHIVAVASGKGGVGKSTTAGLLHNACFEYNTISAHS